MNILISGVGGVGGYFGAKLVKASFDSEYEIHFFAKPDTAEVIKNQGLIIETEHEIDTRLPVSVSSNIADFQSIDLIVVAVKSYDLEYNLEQLRPMVNPNTAFLPLLNGIDNEQKIQQAFPNNQVWNGFAFIYAKKIAAGHILEGGAKARMFFGSNTERKEKLEEFQKWIDKAEINGGLIPDFLERQWYKFFFISTVASFTSFYDCAVGEILINPNYKGEFDLMLNEFLLFANQELGNRKANFALGEIDKKRVWNLVEKSAPESTTSMQRDFRDGNKTELESLTGIIAKSGLDLPIYQKVYKKLSDREFS